MGIIQDKIVKNIAIQITSEVFGVKNSLELRFGRGATKTETVISRNHFEKRCFHVLKYPWHLSKYSPYIQEIAKHNRKEVIKVTKEAIRKKISASKLIDVPMNKFSAIYDETGKLLKPIKTIKLATYKSLYKEQIKLYGNWTFLPTVMYTASFYDGCDAYLEGYKAMVSLDYPKYTYYKDYNQSFKLETILKRPTYNTPKESAAADQMLSLKPLEYYAILVGDLFIFQELNRLYKKNSQIFRNLTTLYPTKGLSLYFRGHTPEGSHLESFLTIRERGYAYVKNPYTEHYTENVVKYEEIKILQ